MCGRGYNQEAVRDAILPDACLTIDQLDVTLELPRRDIVKAAGALISRGLIERVERGCFRLTEAGQKSQAEAEVLTSGPNAPLTCKKTRKKSTLRLRMWRAMAVQKKFTIGDLISAAAKGEEKNARNNAQRYLRALTVVGYLRELPREPGVKMTSNGFKRYAVLRHTGPKAPKLNPGNIYDPNTGETHELP